jgi:two-component system KDP operon response regulator KdpE
VKRIRAWSALPILILSARSAEADKVAALDAGADDYVTKPFGAGELAARIRVALRHAARSANQDEAETLHFGNIEVDLQRRLVRADGREVHLTPIEFRLLGCLARHAGMVLTHRHLLREVWGPSYVDQSHYLRIYMKQLRHKLEPDPTRPRFLLTETGVGYRLAAE